MKIVLVNPNTDAEVTATMCRIAQQWAPPAAQVIGLTALFGAPLITNETALAEAGKAVLALADQLEGCDGVIVSAFGDPGVEALRLRLACPVVGIAEAAMLAAGPGGRRFAVATTTPDLCAAIARRAAAGGHEGFIGTWIAPGDPQKITADALYKACTAAISDGKAEAVIIGGGPLAQLAEVLRDRLTVPLIAPVPEAVRLLSARIGEVS